VKAGHENAWVHADPVRLAQVFVNLLNNAARYTPAGGRIELFGRAPGRRGGGRRGPMTASASPRSNCPRLFEMFSQV
jgi:hypothetical protein